MTSMLAGQITCKRHLEMLEIPVPEIDDGDLLVQLQVASICGSDLPYFLFDTSHPALTGASAPLPPTLSLHELVGVVAKSKSKQFREGDRVLALPKIQHCGLAEYFVSNEDRAVHLPDGPGERLVVSQPLGTVIHACEKLAELKGKTVVVLGQGPVGQLLTALLRQKGVEQLIAVDLLPERLRISKLMGATETVCANGTEVLEMIEASTGGQLADVVVEAIGKEETLNAGAKLIRRNGTLLSFGLPHKLEYHFDFHQFFWNEGRLICSLGPTLDDFRAAVDLISNGVIDVSPLITHKLPFSRAQEAFTLFADRTGGVMKVVLDVSQ